jgi:hypothetical protein
MGHGSTVSRQETIQSFPARLWVPREGQWWAKECDVAQACGIELKLLIIKIVIFNNSCFIFLALFKKLELFII